ncbi:hypothetical protein [Dyadobacter fanqingshengii]|uniref:Uncharacterized protein n=1 Tax=Dyadobacter fanqingshengii TaxID=2906443 RepID=A0A9X1PCQ2_9BACT|nr:hypothetical protein [Dyadobacter fanqingshengii]MCF0040842.1 hypothetical protein [Dyadobacter fanqingshengii]USJ37425.1 hypothetical protein NFI81_06495 [Dyadobacter fanqingshengii]
MDYIKDKSISNSFVVKNYQMGKVQKAFFAKKNILRKKLVYNQLFSQICNSKIKPHSNQSEYEPLGKREAKTTKSTRWLFYSYASSISLRKSMETLVAA